MASIVLSRVLWAIGDYRGRVLGPEHVYRTWMVEATIDSFLKVRGLQWAMTLRIEKVEAASSVDVSIWRLPAVVKVQWWNPPQRLRIGQRWRLGLRLKPPGGFRNPGNFEEAAYFMEQGWVGKGYVHTGTRPERLSEPDWQEWRGLRYALAEKLEPWIQDPKWNGEILAILLGLKAELDPTVRSVFLSSGTAHLLAVSGLHIGLLAGLVERLLRTMGLGSRVVAWGSVVVAWSYASLVGATCSSVRAALMWSFLQWGRVKDEPWPKRCVFLWSLFGVLLWDPLSWFSLGFWLSFGAVGLLFYLSYGHLGGASWRRVVRAEWGLFVGLLPLQVYSFRMLPVGALLANALGIPWFGQVVLPLVVLMGGLGWLVAACGDGLGDSPAWLGVVMRAGFQLTEQSIAILHAALKHLEGGAMPCVGWAPFQGLLLSLCVVVVLIPPGIAKRWIWMLGALGSLMGSDFIVKGPPVGSCRVKVLDVGQGLSVLLQTATHVLLYDMGPRQGAAGWKAVRPHLAWSGIGRLDRLVLSHGDSDHVGGLGAVLSERLVGSIMAAEMDRLPTGLDRLYTVTRCEAGQRWNWDGVWFEVLYPLPGELSSKKHNDASCVIKIRAGHQSLLLTGDIEQKTERKLLSVYSLEQLRSDWLLAPHHGSATSSSESFLKAVSPRFAVFSVGRYNPWHFPKATVKARYEALGIVTYSTAEDGMVAFELL